MSGGFSFGDLRKPKKDKTIEFDSGSTGNTVTVKPHTDWKKKCKETQEELDSWVKSAGIRNRKMDEMAREIAATKKAYEKLQSAFALSNENNSKLQLELDELNTWADMVKKEETQMHELKDEIHMLRAQESMQKKALDILTIQAEKFKFRPHQYSEIARLLICMRIRGNKSQKEQVLKIVGSTAIEAVRDHIFELLEAPYQ